MNNMKLQAIAILLSVLFIVGCARSIKLNGYGGRVGIQHGLKVELINSGENGAIIKVLNTSSDIISINNHILSMQIEVTCNKKVVVPTGHIMIHVNVSPHPDDFIIIGSGQTIEVKVPISIDGNMFSTIHSIYKFEKGINYHVGVKLMPYFGQFSEKTANGVLSKFKVPNYLHEPLIMNSMNFSYK